MCPSNDPGCMKVFTYPLRFTVPAFLGGAPGRTAHVSQWRTPPIKALLRHYWRMAWCEKYKWSSDLSSDFQSMRGDELDLFGAASDGAAESHKSRVRLRLSSWRDGNLETWSATGPFSDSDGKHTIKADDYLAFGKITKSEFAQAGSSAIGAGQESELSIAVPDDSDLLDRAIELMHAWGTLGARRSNGWGSFTLSATEKNPYGLLSLADALQKTPKRHWKDALEIEWPHALGTDERGPLVWVSQKGHTDWKKAIVELAKLRHKLRREIRMLDSQPPSLLDPAHLLGYPVTGNNHQDWDRHSRRLPNPLRFKVVPDPNKANQLVAMVFHFPHSIPAVMGPNPAMEESVWREVHQQLDKDRAFARLT